MSLGSGFLENIPHITFTPTEHQVECVRVGGERNLTYVLTQPNEKSFLVLMLVREVAQCVRGGGGKAVLLVYEAGQVELWTSFLTRMTDLKVAGLDSSELDTGQIVGSAGVLVTTHNTFTKVLHMKHLTLEKCRLVIVDNIQASFNTAEASNFLSLYNSIPKNQAPRLIALTPNILSSNSDQSLSYLPSQLAQLKTMVPASVECSCEIATQLRYLARPRETILEFSCPDLDRQCELELRIRHMLEELKVWIIDQNYSLYDTYGEEFGDLIADIPDPALGAGYLQNIKTASLCSPWVLFMLIMSLFHCVWVSCLGVCQVYQVVVLAMTTNERMNAARYRHFQSGGRGVYKSPFDRGWWQNIVDFLGLRLGGALRPARVEWTKQYTVPGEDGVGDSEPLINNYQFV